MLRLCCNNWLCASCWCRGFSVKVSPWCLLVLDQPLIWFSCLAPNMPLRSSFNFSKAFWQVSDHLKGVPSQSNDIKGVVMSLYICSLSNMDRALYWHICNKLLTSAIVVSGGKLVTALILAGSADILSESRSEPNHFAYAPCAFLESQCDSYLL